MHAISTKLRLSSRREELREKGVALIIGMLGLMFIIPLMGLAVDSAILYSVKSRLQSSVDGAALAAARSLNLGQTTLAQEANAKQNAVNWFYANFPNGNWSTTSTVMNNSTIQVFDAPGNPNLRNVTITAETMAPTYFMRFLNFADIKIVASGNASRRDAVVMIVLDRSGSMSSSPGACAAMVNAAKLFTGQFANGRDRIGLVSFSDNLYLHSAPVTNFQTVLGYTNGSGSGTGAIDSIVCAGGTAMAQAISVAYNELYKVMLPGALNVIMFETDGLPNTLTMNWWDSATNQAGIASGSNCTDTAGKKKGAAGFGTLGVLPNWTTGRTLGTGSVYPNVPAGIVGAIASSDPGGSNNFFTMLQYWTTTTASSFNSTTYIAGGTPGAPGCAFVSTHTPTSLASDLAWLPDTDVYGNSLDTGWKTVTKSSGRIVSSSWSTYNAANMNATDHAAFRARANATLPAHFFGIGLGGVAASPPDYTLMQRMSNDTSGDTFNSPAKYLPCATQPGCVHYNSQPEGTFIFSSSPSALNSAFLALSSQILRLSK